MLDLAGLGLIAPYIALVLKPETLLEGRLSELLFSLGGPTDRETLLLGLSGLLLVLFLGKAIAALGINNVIIGFAQNQQIRLRNRLIAHRLTTVKHCDRIYRLEQGRIVEEGTPEQVLQAPKAVSV